MKCDENQDCQTLLKMFIFFYEVDGDDELPTLDVIQIIEMTL